MKIRDDFLQGTEDWLRARLGKATSSEFSSILAKGQGKTRRSYLKRLVAERLTGKPMETYSNAHMERGKEQEPLARMAYELKTGNIVRQVGFIEHDALACGCSPDALIIDQRGGAEIKSVIPTVQVDTLMDGTYPSEHKAQIQGCLWITGYDFWDFCSYSPDFLDEKHRLYIYRVERDEPYIKMLEDEVTRFLSEVDKSESAIRMCA